jgi:hypothetical protein
MSIEAFHAMEDTSEDGFTPKRTIAYFIHKEDAVRAAQGKAIGGGENGVFPIKIYQTFDEYDLDRIRRLIESAKNKLTGEEREAVFGHS